MPKGHSGIKRASSVPSFMDTKKYEKPAEYASTSGYSAEYVKDPNGTYFHAETHEKYSVEEHYAENPGFKKIRSAPVGSVIVVQVPDWEFHISGKVPAHEEWYEVIQVTKSTKGFRLRKSTDAKGRYVDEFGLEYPYSGKWNGYVGKMGTVKDIQSRFHLVERVKIYTPKRVK